MVVFQVPCAESDAEFLRGVLATILMELTSVMEGRAKSTFFRDFYLKRLDTNQRRKLKLFLFNLAKVSNPEESAKHDLNEQVTDNVTEEVEAVLKFFFRGGSL